MQNRNWPAIIETQIKPLLTVPGITRREIAERLGLPHYQTNNALRYYGIEIPCDKIKKRTGKNKRGYIPCPMETVLTENECSHMRRFLACLLTYANMYPTKKLDINVFMSEYRKNCIWGKEELL
jgi:hypothetical protein